MDNFAFWLAEKGFLTESLKEAAERTRDVKLNAARGNRRAKIKRGVLFVSWLILVVGWGVSWFSEYRGRTLSSAACKRFTVQFGDDSLLLDGSKLQLDTTLREKYAPALMQREKIELLFSHFSGKYELGYRFEKSRYPFVRHKRAVYTGKPTLYRRCQRYLRQLTLAVSAVVQKEVVADYDEFTPVRDKSLGRFEFCKGRDNYPGAWTFKIDGFNDAWDRDGDGEDCVDWLLRSPPTSEGQLENVPTEGWRIWTEDGVAEPVDFKMQCDDCQRLVDCNFNGECRDSQCNCDPGFLGSKCSEPAPCESIQIDFIGDSSWDYSSLGSFDLLHKDGSTGPFTTETDVQLVYGRPVYMQPAEFSSLQDAVDQDGLIDVCYYSGSRWTLSSFPAWRFQERFLPKLRGREQEPHSFWEELSTGGDTRFISQVTTNGSPAGHLTWFQILNSSSRGDYGPYGVSVGANLNIHCAGDCDQSRDLFSCGISGNCTDGACECKNCFGGHYCEFAPTDLYTQNQWFDSVVNTDLQSQGEEYFVSFWRDPERCPDGLKV